VSARPLGELGWRAAAIGFVVGVAITGEIVRLTPDLRAEPARALLFAGPVVCLYTAGVLAAVAALAFIQRILAALGLRSVDLTSARLLWGLVAAYAAFVVVNEGRAEVDWIERWRVHLRMLVVAGVAALLASALLRRRPRRFSRQPIERVLALGLIAAVLCAGLYALRGRGAVARPTDVEDLISLAPRFEPEPASAFTGVLEVPRTRVMVVGLDGASWDRIDRGIAEGRLPTFARLEREGRRAPLRTLHPTNSPMIWTSMMTGVLPERHGVDGFYMVQLPRLGVERLRLRRAFDPVEELFTALGDLKRVPVTSSLRRVKAVWNLADEAGLRSAVLGLWATWPPEPLQNGRVVSDHASLAKRHEWLDRRKTSKLTAGVTTYPTSLEARLIDLQRSPEEVRREELERFMPVDEATWREFAGVKHFSKGVPLSAFRSSQLNDAFYFEAALRLWQADDLDLMIVYGRSIDELSHFFYEAGVPEAESLGWSAEDVARFGGIVDRTYDWNDRWLARLVAEVDDDPRTVLIVVSDHGWAREPDGGYNHNFAPDGILIVYGADVCGGEGCRPLLAPTILDVAPTVLERLGLPISEEIAGVPLSVFRAPHEVPRVAHYGASLTRSRSVSSGVDAELREKLEALGYMED
jgi:hypothetical protein